MSKTKEVLRRALVAALREVLDGLDGDARRPVQPEPVADCDGTRALRSVEALREMLRASIADIEATSQGVSVEAWSTSPRVAQVRAFLAATAPNGGV